MKMLVELLIPSETKKSPAKRSTAALALENLI